VLATERNLNTQIERIREKKGWEGQPKGLLHTLWERGWIDVNNLDKYTIEIAMQRMRTETLLKVASSGV
jgi:hypothetical protein